MDTDTTISIRETANLTRSARIYLGNARDASVNGVGATHDIVTLARDMPDSLGRVRREIGRVRKHIDYAQSVLNGARHEIDRLALAYGMEES